MIVRFAISLIVLGAASPLSASLASQCTVVPPGTSCTATATSLTPIPTAEALAVVTGNGFFTNPVTAESMSSLTFQFEVAGPDTLAVPVVFEPGGFFMGTQPIGETVCGLQDLRSQACNTATVISPGYYLGGASPTIGPFSGSISGTTNFGNEVWLVPNEWNTVTILTDVTAVSEPNSTVRVDSSFTMQFVVATPEFAAYQFVVAPEPRSAVLVAAGLFVLGFIRIRARRRQRSRDAIWH